MVRQRRPADLSKFFGVRLDDVARGAAGRSCFGSPPSKSSEPDGAPAVLHHGDAHGKRVAVARDLPVHSITVTRAHYGRRATATCGAHERNMTIRQWRGGVKNCKI